ncbi:MAG: HAD family hydrolase [Ktedonobacteraceae bacterium]
MSNLIIFDLDGVITSEEAYWDAAGLTLHEISYSHRLWHLDGRKLGSDRLYHPVKTADESRRLSRATLPINEILAYKARAINSNWDTCYVAVCLRLISLLAQLGDLDPLLPLRPWDAAWLGAFREQIASHKGRDVASQLTVPIGILDLPVFQGYTGLDLINCFDAYASETLVCPLDTVFSRHSPFWAFCRDIFQEWYLGDELYAQTHGHAPAQPGKPGCIHFEQPLLPVERIRKTLHILRDAGYTLGFATGRVRQEAFYPLERYGLLPYFDESHICIYDDVELAEAELRKRGDQTLLGKPHPFQFLSAALGSASFSVGAGEDVDGWMERLRRPLLPFLVVGDSTSDILGGRAAGAITVSVLTGAHSSEARKLLADSLPDFSVEDMTKLPELVRFIDSLETIQRLQFSQREKAEKLLRRWFARHMSLTVESVTLAPKAVSLNSFNGFYRRESKEYFFKTHVEEQGSIPEYYHAGVLQQAGYNIVMPLQTMHEEGRQMVIYPVVRWPVIFDLMRDIETGNMPDSVLEMVASAEERECNRLLDIYDATLAHSTAEEHAQAPIHQLFWHRLTGERYKRFYADKQIVFPEQGNGNVMFSDLLHSYWSVNGQILKIDGEQATLGTLIEKAATALRPERAAMTVIGHGDAHFGNVFLEDSASYLYFDPAFAGRHMPLLDIVKPLFHNVFATWMYFPREVARDLHLTVALRASTIYVEHDYMLSPARQAILRTKLTRLLAPLLDMLRSRQALPEDWRAIVRGALLCCPLLTINLLDYDRLPAAISWLGLSQVKEMGTFDLL